MGKRSSINDTALTDAIRSVGVGKHGSWDLKEDQISRVLIELKNGPSELVRGAFFGSLIAKGPSSIEKSLESALEEGVFSRPDRLSAILCDGAPLEIVEICAELIGGGELSYDRALRLGRFLFSDEKGEGARGLAAAILRVRYETDAEYAGILDAIAETILPAFASVDRPRLPIVQLAEPFDGVERSYLLTPLIARFLNQRGYTPVSLTGRSGGPKMQMNLEDLARSLGGVFLSPEKGFETSSPEWGYFLSQKDVSTALDAWVERRRLIVKRPFLATLERFVNPLAADLLIASAFHAPYAEKMAVIAEHAGFKAGIILRRGQEGTLSFSLNRPAEIVAFVRKPEGTRRHAFSWNPEGHGYPLEEDGRIESPQASDNADLIRKFVGTPTEIDPRMRKRMEVTLLGIGFALDWIEANR